MQTSDRFPLGLPGHGIAYLPLDLVPAEDTHDARRVAYGYVEDAFAEAQQDGRLRDRLAAQPSGGGNMPGGYSR